MDVMSGPETQLASDEEREWTVGVLRSNHAAGRLTVTEFEERSAKAYASRTLGDLRALLVNLPMPRDDATSSSPSQPIPSMPLTPDMPLYDRRALRHMRRQGMMNPGPWHHGTLRQHAASYGSVMVLLVAIWALTGAGYPWFIWPMLGWGIAVVSHAAATLSGPRK